MCQYSYRASSRATSNIVISIACAVYLIMLFRVSVRQSLELSVSGIVFFMVWYGTIPALVLAQLMNGILKPVWWTSTLTNNSFSWLSPRWPNSKCTIPVNDITRVEKLYGYFRYRVVLSMSDGAVKTIPSVCYGNDDELISAFSELESDIEVIVNGQSV